jgi:hypothetical protein
MSGQFFPRAANARTSTSSHMWDWRIRSGARGTSNAKGRSDTVARPVTIGRTRPVTVGCLLESTGRWHCGVRSVQAARPVNFSAMRASGDRTLGRVRSVMIGASGHLSTRVTSFLDRWRSCGSVLYLYTWQRSNGAAWRDRTRTQRPVSSTDASGQCDNSNNLCLTAISCWGRL